MATNKRLIKSNDDAAPVVPTSFNTVTYTGDGSATQQVTGVGFQPDLFWVKARNLSQAPNIFDSIRGGELLRTNSTSASGGNYLSYINDGIQYSVTDPGWNQSGQSYVAWCWKAGGAAVTNTDGTITSQVSANTEAGFSIVKYTSNGSYTSSDTIGHGLSQKPKLVIWKPYETTSSDWFVQYEFVDGSVDYLILNNSDAVRHSASTYLFQENVLVNYAGSSGQDTIAYCFAEVAGFSKFGSYVGTNAPGNTIVTGFEPAFVLTKRSSASGAGWNIFDNKRGLDRRLHPNLSNAESIDSPAIITFNSDGFTFNTADSWNNGAYTYIYMAFANQF